MSLFYTPREVRMLTPKKRKAEEQEKYSCGWCYDEYDSETDLHVHKRVKHRGKLAELLMKDTVCKICITNHGDGDQLVYHIKTTHLLSSKDAEHVHREIFICDICNQLYFNKKMLSIHMQHIHDKQHRNKLMETCPKCDKLVRVKHIWFHFQKHFIQSVACCPICLQKCENRKDLNLHVKLHPHFYRCDICLYETKIKDNFTTHMQLHNSNLHLSPNIAIDESLLWRCFIPRKLPKKNDYNIGLRGLRIPELHICVLCRGICKEDEKAGHIAKYHLVDIVATKKQYMCVCGEQFFNNVLLKHHVFKLKGMHKAVDT